MRSEREGALLGAVLDSENPGKLLQASGLSPADLTDPGIRSCWDLAIRLTERHREVNAVGLFIAGRAIKALADDDLGWIQGLQARNTLTTAEFMQMAGALRSESRSRAVGKRLLALGTNVLEKGLTPNKLGDELEHLRQKLARSYMPSQTAEGAVSEILDAWDRLLASGKARRVPTHIMAVDELMGGWVPNLNLLIGPPGSLKSGFMATVIEAQLKAGMRVGLFGLEDGVKWVVHRIFAKHVGMSLRDFGSAKKTPEQEQAINELAPQIHDLFKNLLVFKRGGLPALDLCGWSAQWIFSEGCQCIYVDNATEIGHRARGGQQDQFRLAVADSVSQLRDLAVNHEVPVVLLAHTGPGYEERTKGLRNKAPRSNEIAESSAFDKRGRLILGTWLHGRKFRLSALKATEDDASWTLEFGRLDQQAMVSAEDVRTVDLGLEERTEQASRREAAIERKDAEWVDRRIKRKHLAIIHGLTGPKQIEKQEEKPMPQKAQPDLFGGDK